MTLTAAMNTGEIHGHRVSGLARRKSTRRTSTLAAVLAASVVASGCATDDPNRRTKIGAGVGAVAGAVIGNQVGGQTARIIGAGIGALAGGAVGRYQDKQQQALEKVLQAERDLDLIQVERLADDVLLVRMSDKSSFDVGSAAIKPDFLSTLDKISTEMNTFDKTVLHVVGYTDSSGSETFNEDLSRRRAASVTTYLRNDGVLPARLNTEGRGENEPLAPNDSSANRAKNRRVEIYIKPVVEGQEDRALESPRPV